MLKRLVITFLVIAVLLFSSVPVSAASTRQMIGINVVLNTGITNTILTDLGKHGTVRDVVYEINALTMQVRAGDLASIQSLPYVAAANPDAARNGAPIDTVAATTFGDGLSTWDLDAINVTDFGFNNRQVKQDGTGVYVAVLDTGLLDSWRQYFPQERIASQYAIAFGGGGGEQWLRFFPTQQVGTRPEFAWHPCDQHHPGLQPEGHSGQRCCADGNSDPC